MMAAFCSGKRPFFGTIIVESGHSQLRNCQPKMTIFEISHHFVIQLLTAFGCYDFLATPCQPGLLADRQVAHGPVRVHPNQLERGNGFAFPADQPKLS
ncbi:hypothetical protein [Humidesulfovibrio idahonensis]